MRANRKAALAVAIVLVFALGTWFVLTRRPRSFVSRARNEVASLVSAESIGKQVAALSTRPHRAGSDANAAVGALIEARLKRAGLVTSQAAYEVAVWEPLEMSLAMTSPSRQAFDLRERAFAEDPDTRVAESEPPFLAYVPDGDVEAPVVYANYGSRADWDFLEKNGVDPKGAIALVRAQGICRGMKARLAAERGVKGLLLYPEPRDQGFAKPAYPEGPNLPRQGVQRGSMLAYDLYPGDPRSARERGGPDTFSKLPALPISQETAEAILKELRGKPAPEGWTGWLKTPYVLGTGPGRVRLKVRGALSTKTIRNILAILPGTDPKAPPLMLGAHYDAWVYGAVDPDSGVAVVLEAADALARLRKAWWKPKRSIWFAFWDGEEYGMFGSTKWAEQQLDEGGQALAAYVNVDSAVSANDLALYVAPGLRHPLERVLEEVREPGTGKRLSDVRGEWQLPGFSSDTAPFAGLGGTPIAEIRFGRWWGGSHTLYDDVAWLRRFGDPGFARSAALGRILVLYLGELASGPVFPYRLSELAPYADEALRGLLRDAPGQVAGWLANAFKPLFREVELYETAARSWDERFETLHLAEPRATQIDSLVHGVLGAFVAPGGRAHGPAVWGKRNLLLGPSETTGCAAEPFAPLARAVRSGDREAISAQVASLRLAFAQARTFLAAADAMAHGTGRSARTRRSGGTSSSRRPE